VDIYSNISKECITWKKAGKKIVFTNGCFDLLHQGHKDLLNASLSFGDILIVGLNSDISVKMLKGEKRPIQSEKLRKKKIIETGAVLRVYIFDDLTPIKLIKIITPDILVKGGDYKLDQIVGAEYVLGYGGEVKIVPLTPGYSTTDQIEKIKRQ